MQRVKKIFEGMARFGNQAPQRPTGDLWMVRNREGSDIARFREDDVASVPSRYLPAQPLQRPNYLLRPVQRDRRHQTGTSTSRMVTVSGKPFSARTARHS